jgi:hypothetical protein
MLSQHLHLRPVSSDSRIATVGLSVILKETEDINGIYSRRQFMVLERQKESCIFLPLLPSTLNMQLRGGEA